MASACEFCRVVDGEEDVHVLFDTEEALAMLDRSPAVDGHALVVPKTHCTGLTEMDAALASHVFEAVHRTALALERALDADGVSLFHTSGPLVGTVEHMHVHVVPRREDDRIHVSLEREPLGDAEGRRLAEAIRESL